MADTSSTQNAPPIAIENDPPDRSIVYKTAGETQLRMHVFNPENLSPDDKRPAIVFFFGGGWINGAPDQFYPHCEYLAKRGMVAISAEYRVKSRDGTTPAECVKDAKSAVRWIRQHADELGIDSDRIAVGGGSAGGHLAAATAIVEGFEEAEENQDVSSRPNALVLFNPVFDNGPDGYGHDRVQPYWREFSPLHNIDDDTPPTVVFLGTEDDLVPVQTAQEYQKRMAANGKRCDLHLYEGQGHGFFNYGRNDSSCFFKTVGEMDRFLVSLGYLDPKDDQPMAEAVHYEDFGAAGDGVTDDLPAIVAAHAHANEHGLPVRSDPGATYHLGRRALTVVIETDTDWSTSRFIIDDSKGVEDHKLPLFEIRSRLQPVPLEIDELERGQDRLDRQISQDCLVLVENENRKRYIRRGLNQNTGHIQQEVFILRKDGAIEGAIEWDYETVTRVEAMPMDPGQLVLRGGVFTHIANQMRQEVGYNYWWRNIRILRSNVVVDGLTLRVTGETEVGHPYSAFLRADQCANITFRNCQIDGRKIYTTIGRAGKPVSMGTYGYGGDLVVNMQMINCRMEREAIHDDTRWGVMAFNFIKDLLIEDCVLSRADVHMGVFGRYVIRRTILGHQGINAIGRGLLLIEDCSIYNENIVLFRPDYGSAWEGDVVVRNCRWIPEVDTPNPPAAFRMRNDGQHDFGYPCSMPETILLDGLFIDDSLLVEDGQELVLIDYPEAPPMEEQPYPYQLTKRLEVRSVTTASGRAPRISNNPVVSKAITY